MSSFAPKAKGGAESLARHDIYWPAQVTVLAAILLSYDLPDSLTIRQTWLIPAIESVLFVVLVASTPWVPAHRHRERRRVAMSLVAIVTLSNLINLALLVHVLLHRAQTLTLGQQLILAGVEIWVTNVLLFTVWYWELDRGGPIARRREVCPAPDFLFANMTDPGLGGLDWRPGYIDYLYTSFTNATAFSPTDTMPLTAQAKLLMLVQSLASLVTIGMVFARAINILVG